LIYCVEWGVKLYSLTHTFISIKCNTKREDKRKTTMNTIAHND